MLDLVIMTKIHSMNNCSHASHQWKIQKFIFLLESSMVLLREESVSFDTNHVSKGYDTIIPEELSILDLCSTADLAVSNTFIEKNQSKLITFSSLQLTTYKLILFKRSFLKHLRDVKVICNERYGSRKIPPGNIPTR